MLGSRCDGISKLPPADAVPDVDACDVNDVFSVGRGGRCCGCVWDPSGAKLPVRYASSSLTSIPDDARTSVSSEASASFSKGREGGPIDPGGAGPVVPATVPGAEPGVEAAPFAVAPFITGDWPCEICIVLKFGDA